MIVFWLIVAAGALWTAYNIGSDRRNPPMATCPDCHGQGQIAGLDCVWCGGHGYVERGKR